MEAQAKVAEAGACESWRPLAATGGQGGPRTHAAVAFDPGVSSAAVAVVGVVHLVEPSLSTRPLHVDERGSKPGLDSHLDRHLRPGDGAARRNRQ